MLKELFQLHYAKKLTGMISALSFFQHEIIHEK